MLAYLFRFDAKKGFYIYPESANRNSKELRLNQGSTYEKNVAPRDDVSLLKCGLRIPSYASSYDNFKVQMVESENIFKSQFSNDLKS